MIDSTSIKNARARARMRKMAPPQEKPRIRVRAATAPSPIAIETPREDEEAPFDPPDADEIAAMGAWTGEEDAGDEHACAFSWHESAPVEAEHQCITHAECAADDAEPVFAPETTPVLTTPPISSAQQRFEADAISMIASHASAHAPVAENELELTQQQPAGRSNDPAYEQPAPPITIHGSWDRQEISGMLDAFASDRRMARASITIERGGVDAALARFDHQPPPDLLILDSTLRARELLDGVDHLLTRMGEKGKIFVVGAVNDIGLLRELAARGVKYVVPPIREDDLVRAVCGLYAEADTSHVIAIMGARGGVGASTLAHNLAWSLAERHGAETTLIDLDIGFGAAAFNVQRPATLTFADAAGAQDIGAIERAAVHHTPRLQILAAPTELNPAYEIDIPTLEHLVTRARRATSFVVLDLPHAWHPWVRRALTLADEAVIVAAPELASLRNTDNILKDLKNERGTSDPLLVMSMCGVPKRPEISAKEFAQALDTKPIATLAYEPALFGAAALAGQMLGEAAPRAKATRTIDALAHALTGLPPIKNTKTLTLKDTAHAMKAAAHRMQSNADQTVDDAPLELLPVEDEYIAKARGATEASLDTPAAAPPRAKSWLPLRVACYVAAILLLSSVWRLQNDSSAEAHAPTPPASAAELSDDTRAAWGLLLDGREREAAARLRILSEQGFAPAQYFLANAYLRGTGLSANRAQARLWTERAAQSGHARAMHDLGVYYASGDSASADDAAALLWFRRAAERDVADSQYNLGVFYQEGRGVTADASESLFWLRLAARRGGEDAAARIRAVEAQLSADEIARVHARVHAFQPRMTMASLEVSGR